MSSEENNIIAITNFGNRNFIDSTAGSEEVVNSANNIPIIDEIKLPTLRKKFGEIKYATSVLDSGSGIECLECEITCNEVFDVIDYDRAVKELAERTERGEIKLYDEEKINNKQIKIKLLESHSIVIVIDISADAEDYIESVKQGVEKLISKLFEISPLIHPHVFLSNHYFESKILKKNSSMRAHNDNLELIRAISTGGKSNQVLALDCLAQSIEHSRSNFSVVVISATIDNMNSGGEIAQSIEKLRQVVNKGQVDFHCVGVGGRHDMINLDNLARMSTGRGTYQHANGAENIVESIYSLHHELAVPSLRVDARLTNEEGEEKMYKMQVDRCEQVMSSGDDNIANEIATTSHKTSKFSARLFGKFSNKTKIELIIGGGENHPVLDYEEADLRHVVNLALSDEHSLRYYPQNELKNIFTRFRRIKIQIDAIASCLKIAMDQETLDSFRAEMVQHKQDLEEILDYLKFDDNDDVPKITYMDLFNLRFINDVIIYHESVNAFLGKELTEVNEEGKGVVNISLEDFAILTAKAYSCDYKSLRAICTVQLTEVAGALEKINFASDNTSPPNALMFRYDAYNNINSDAHAMRILGTQKKTLERAVHFLHATEPFKMINVELFIRKKLFPQLMNILQTGANATASTNEYIIPVCERSAIEYSQILFSDIGDSQNYLTIGLQVLNVLDYHINNLFSAPEVKESALQCKKAIVENIVSTESWRDSVNDLLMRMGAIINDKDTRDNIDHNIDHNNDYGEYIPALSKEQYEKCEELLNQSFARGNLHILAGCISLQGFFENPQSNDDIEDLQSTLMNLRNALMDIINKRLLRRKFAGENSSSFAEMAFKLMGVRDYIVEESASEIKQNAEKMSKKSLELHMQNSIISLLKKKGIKVIKPKGKRKENGKKGASDKRDTHANGSAVHIGKRVNPSSFTEEEVAMIISAFDRLTYASLKRGANSAHSSHSVNIDSDISTETNSEFCISYENNFLANEEPSALLYNLMINFPDIFANAGVDMFACAFANIGDEYIRAVASAIINKYTEDQQKKMMARAEEESREDKIRYFVLSDKIYAVAGFLQGAMLGTNLSKYLGTLCEAVADGKLKVPLVEEKLAMIISGKLIIDKASGKVLATRCVKSTSAVFNNTACIELVEDIALSSYHSPLRYNSQALGVLSAINNKLEQEHNGAIPREIINEYKNKVSIDKCVSRGGYWMLGRKKYIRVRAMLRGAVSEEVFAELFPHWYE